MSRDRPMDSNPPFFLQNGGETGRIIAQFNWEETSLGPLGGWPAYLQSTVAMLLRSPVPIVTLWGEDGVMLYNDAYSIFAGARHPALLGSKIREGWPEVADFNDNVMKTCLSGGILAYTDQELTLYRNDSPEQVWMNLDYSPIIDGAGRPVGIIAIVVETTAKVRAEQSLRASEENFRLLAQALPAQVWSASASGQLDWCNDRVYEYSGTESGDFHGADWLKRVHPEDAESAAQRWSIALASGDSYESQHRIRRIDGTYRWHLARARAVRNDAGAIIRWIGSSTDIEDQKAAAQYLQYRNETLAQQVAERTAERDRMWRLSTDMMMVARFDGTITALNPAWTQLLGWSDGELIGRTFVEFVHPADRAATLMEMDELSRGGRTFAFENRYQRKDGGYNVLSWTAVPDAQYIHAVGRDVTAERLASEMHRRTELALQQAQKMETIGKLTGGVAHDFNNLLQVISGNLQLLMHDVAADTTASRRVANALAGVDRGAKLASQLLAFGRRQPLTPKPLRIGRLVSGMEDMLRRSLGEAIDIEIIVSGGLWHTFADPAQLENAILNLAINARDAMAGIGKMTIEVGNAYLDSQYADEHVEVTAGQYVLLAVTDTGVGMPSEVLSRVFDPFFTTKPEGKGTGLGLSMVYGFVKQSGGHVAIYSEIGHGTTVKVYLPRTHEKAEDPQPVASLPIIGGAETILLAEDDAEVRRTVFDMLSNLGYRVLKASDAQSALAIIDSGVPIDLLFSDVVMPGTLRSPELARKARERLPRIAVLFTSGYTENAIVHGGRLDHGVDLLSKPYSREALARKLRQVLDAQKRRDKNKNEDKDRHQAIDQAPISDAAPFRLPLSSTASHPPPAEIDAQDAIDAPASLDTAPNIEPLPVQPLSAEPEGALTSRAWSILLVEDDDLIRWNTAELLREMGHQVVEAPDAKTALYILSSTLIDILLTDLGLPDSSGEDLAQQARQLQQNIAVIFATGSDHTSSIPGAALLRKPYDSTRIAHALGLIVRR